MNFVFNMRFIAMFITAVCVLFLINASLILKRKFSRTRSIEKLVYAFYLKVSRFNLFRVSPGVRAIINWQSM